MGVSLEIDPVETDDVVSTVIAEAKKGYEMIYLGQEKRRSCFPLLQKHLATQLRKQSDRQGHRVLNRCEYIPRGSATGESGNGSDRYSSILPNRMKDRIGGRDEKNNLVYRSFSYHCRFWDIRVRLSGPGGPDRGVALQEQGKAYDGYTLFAPLTSKRTYLIDMEGNIVHTWDSQYYPGLYAELLPNGNLLRAGTACRSAYCGIDGIGGYIEEIDWNGKVVWSFKDMFTKNEVQHHCFDRMPNGNTMILGWERIENEKMIAKGRDPKTIPTKSVKGKGIYHRDFWLDFVWEVNPAGKIVWEWHVFDHLGKGPDKLDPNYILPMPVGEIYATYDWSHFNIRRVRPGDRSGPDELPQPLRVLSGRPQDRQDRVPLGQPLRLRRREMPVLLRYGRSEDVRFA